MITPLIKKMFIFKPDNAILIWLRLSFDLLTVKDNN